MASKNSTFRGEEPTWANACVGNNGDPGYMEYSKGFSTAANVLIDQVLKGHGIVLSTDELVYPVCFNMRHSVELRLKGGIEILMRVAEIKGAKLSFNLAGSHDIGNIWSFFKTESERLDGRYIDINSLVDSTLRDIAEVDATGQTFRYPISTESQKHLTDVSLINFVRLKINFNTLEENLDRLHQLNLWIEDEYGQGTFTAKFSRPMLYELARALPPFPSWREIDFSEIKRNFIEDYDVTSNEFSRAINKIKGQYYLAALIESPLEVKGIDKNLIFKFLDHWRMQLEEENSSDPFEDSDKFICGIKRRAAIRGAVWRDVEGLINPETLAGLNAIYYFAQNKTFVEYYDRFYLSELNDSQRSFERGIDEVQQSFFHIFGKMNAVTNFAISFFALGQIELAELLISKYKVDNNLNWVRRARTRELFEFPSYAGY